jgi:hypothetical protein
MQICCSGPCKNFFTSDFCAVHQQWLEPSTVVPTYHLQPEIRTFSEIRIFVQRTYSSENAHSAGGIHPN